MDSNREIIQEALNHFKMPDPSEIKLDLSQAEKMKKPTKRISLILNKYNNDKQLTNNLTKNYVFDICNYLKNSKQDFIACLKIIIIN